MKKTPKGKTPSLIGGSNGRPSKTAAQRKCVCSRCSDDISSGGVCFDIPKTGGFSSKKRFCRACYEKIIEQTEKDIEILKDEMGT